FGSLSARSGLDDQDNDGLSNYYEYRAHLNPLDATTFNDNISDGERDSDGDRLSNLQEQTFDTLPDKVDTDDDGVPDGDEVTGLTAGGTHLGVTDPLNSLNPRALRALSLNGNSRVVVQAQARHSMNTEWTLSAWVWPSNTVNGVVVARTLADGSANYELGVVTSGGVLYPYTRYTGMLNGKTNEVRVQYGLANVTFINATNRYARINAQEWTHLAASYQAASNTLSLFVNGDLVAWRLDAVSLPLTGSGAGLPLGGELTIGGGRRTVNGTGVANGFAGYIDDVRIAAKAYSAAEILQMAGGQTVVTGAHVGTNVVTSAAVSASVDATAAAPYEADELIIGLRPDISQATVAGEMANLGLQMMKGYKIVPAIHVKITDGTELRVKMAALKADKRFTYVEPNFTLKLFDTLPNDWRFAEQWGLHNTGLNGGIANADIGAPVAWDISTGDRNIVVAVIDTGVDFGHEDLKANMWVNPGEIPNNLIDDDNNGYIDDYNGFNFGAANDLRNGNGNPMDAVTGHGTHVAGIIGAVGNNAMGICGVNWKVQIMALRIERMVLGRPVLDAAAALAAIEYAWRNGARVINASWGGYAYSQALYDAIKVAGDNDVLFVAAAANDGLDNDLTPAYPASYDLDNIISVAATDNRDALADFSNYGARTVDLGAPGVAIMSTLPTNVVTMGQGYGFSSGTSMATPHVAGAAALVLSVDGRLSCAAVKAALLNNVDPDPALRGMTLTGGRLDIGNVLLNTASGAGIAHGLAAWFRFDDGGTNAQDFTLTKDWRSDWRYAGVMDGPAFSNFAWTPTGDSDGDGMPDWWEEAMGFDPLKSPAGDADGDGLSDFYEYLAGTDPFRADSNNNGISDYDEDGLDGDELSNGVEQDIYATDPSRFDTDDDGVSDSAELIVSSDPKSSRSPYIMRALKFTGGSDSTVVLAEKINGKNTGRFSLPVWTIEMFVNLDSLPVGSASCPLLSRSVERTGDSNYEIGITNGSLYLRFGIMDSGDDVRLVGGMPLTTNKWTHIAGRFDGKMLTLFVNGESVASTDGQTGCSIGPGDLIIGSPSFVGRIMGVRVWKIAQADEMIKELFRQNLFFGDVSSLGGYLRVAGAGLVKETATTLATPQVPSRSGQGYMTIDMFMENWTLEGWVRTTTDGIVIARRNDALAATDNYNYYLGVRNGTLIGRFAMEWLWHDIFGNLHVERSLDGNDIVGEMFVADGLWHHVAYIRNNDGCFLYVDGILDSKQERILPPGQSEEEYILCFYGPVVFGQNMAGDLDELRIWNRALSVVELRDVASHNLSGTEQGLISYFNFDFQTGKLADERSSRRNPVEEYGVYVGDAQLIKGDKDGPKILTDLLRTFARVALVGYLSANDGGKTVEDYVNPMGVIPFDNEKYAGHLNAGVSFVDLGADVPYFADGDADGLPDAWESQWGLDPSSALGNAGQWGDPDKDGLNNRDEYLAGSDPLSLDSKGTGFSDYDNRASSTNRTYGELYNDGDGMLDSWEIQFPDMLSPLYYDANQDPDGDGWSNFAEFMINEAGVQRTDPTDPALYPQPYITFKFNYGGLNGNAPIIVNAYNSGRMDGEPMASVTYANPGLPFEVRTNRFDVGYMLEGKAWFFAFIDNDGDGNWTTGEPAGICQTQPVLIEWGEVPALTIELTDLAPPGYARFQWPDAGFGTNSYNVNIRRTSTAGAPIVLNRTINAPRNYVHEGDFQYAGIFGLDSGASTTPGYQWFAGGVTGTFSMAWGSTQAMPTVVWPIGGELVLAQNRFDWRMDASATKFQIQISTNPTFTTTALDTTAKVPSPKPNGITSYVPFDSNIGTLSNGLSYFWRVRSINPYSTSAWMTNSSFRLIMLESLAGAYTVSGEVFHFG
ncbi:MAG: S8 family serine peptidase, partial [bacterium]